MSDGGTQVGLTAGVGWEVGLSRTLAVPADAVWAWLQSPAGQDVWLAPGARARPERGSPVTVAGDPVGTVRSGGTGRRWRLAWRPPGWDHDVTTQVVVQGSGGRSVLRFHQEWLADAAERERQREFWRSVVDRAEQDLSA